MQLDDSFYQAADAILSALGVAPSAARVNMLAAWSWCEKPHYAGAAWQWNNPLNTTLRESGSSSVNSVGVQAYPTQEEGAQACAATIENGYYPTILAGLRAGDPGTFFAAPGEWSTWGTDLGCVQQAFASLDPPPAWSYQAGGGSGGGGVPAGGSEPLGPGVLGSAAPLVLVGLFAVGLIVFGVADLEGWRL